MAAEIVRGMLHVFFRPAQGPECLADFRMVFRAGAAAGVTGSALAAGVAGALALFGAAGAVAMNVNARIKVARASKLAILAFMDHSSRPNCGSDRRIVPLFPSAYLPLVPADITRPACAAIEASRKLPGYRVTWVSFFF
jgi:hypothetical protein